MNWWSLPKRRGISEGDRPIGRTSQPRDLACRATSMTGGSEHYLRLFGLTPVFFPQYHRPQCDQDMVEPWPKLYLIGTAKKTETSIINISAGIHHILFFWVEVATPGLQDGHIYESTA